MGRIKTKKIKRNTKMIFGKHQENLSIDFEENKKLITSKYTIASKKLRNIIAGYCTRLKKSEN